MQGWGFLCPLRGPGSPKLSQIHHLAWSSLAAWCYCYPWPLWQCHTVLELPQVASSCPCVTQILLSPLHMLLQLHLGGVLFLLPVILVEGPLEDIPSSGLLISSLSLFMIDLHTNVSPGTNIFCLRSCLPFWLHPGSSPQQLRCFV